MSDHNREEIVRKLAREAGAHVLSDFIEEVECTRDDITERYDESGVLIEWTTHAVPPPGPGWRIKDNSKDTKTVWHRFIPQ